MVTGQCKKSGYTLKHPHRHYLNSTEQTINLFTSHLVFHQHSYDRSVFLFSSLLGNPSIVFRIVIKISVTFIQQEVALFSAFVIVFVTVFLSLSLDDGWRQPQVRNQSTELSVSSSRQIVLYVQFISFHPLLLLHIILSAQNGFSLSLSTTVQNVMHRSYRVIFIVIGIEKYPHRGRRLWRHGIDSK